MNWKQIIDDEKQQEYFIKLVDFLKFQRTSHIIYPPKEIRFNAFKHVDLCDVKVVILGQDPYINAGEAMGLSFSVPKNIKIPPSLVNIYKEIAENFNVAYTKEHPRFANGDLTAWCQQGVLLLNRVLTVNAGFSNSHQNKGWEIFTNKIISTLNDSDKAIVFMLWGAKAQSVESLLNNKQHLVLKAGHPSPLNTKIAFRGCKHFAIANQFLEQHNLDAIDWLKC